MEFPYIERLYQQFRDEGLTVLAVESKGDRTGARALVEENHYSFPVLFDTEGIHKEKYGVYSFPTSFLLDPEGNIVFRHVGFYPGMEAVLENEVRQLLHLPTGREEPSA